METVRRALLEDPFYLYVALVLAWVVLAISYRQRRTRRSAIYLLVPPVLGACVCLLACLVVTDREEIMAASQEIAGGVEAGSLAAAEKYLDERFSGFYGSKQHALSRGRDAMERHRPGTVELRNVELTVRGRRAEMSVTTIIEPGAGELAGRRLPLDWEVNWVKLTVGDRHVWRISSVTPRWH